MTSYKTTIGGAFGALGTTLVGIGILPQLSGAPSKLLTYVAVAGFAFSAIGKFLTALFAADAKDVKCLQEQMYVTQTAVRTGDTTILKKS